MKVTTTYPDSKKYYPVRAGNSLPELRKWINWAKKNYKGQKLIIVNEYKIRMKDKKYRDYWKMRYKLNLESKYIVYGSN